MDSEEEEIEWLVIPLNANHTVVSLNPPPRYEAKPEDIAALMVGVVVFAAMVGAACFFCSKKQEDLVNRQLEEKRESKGKELAKTLTPRKWNLDETEQMSLSCWDETESYSLGRGDDDGDATEPVGNVHVDFGGEDKPPSFTRRKSSMLLKSKSNLFQTCQICSEDFHEGDDILQSNNPNCGHVFHKVCMEKWLNYQYSCPICGQIFALQPVEA